MKNRKLEVLMVAVLSAVLAIAWVGSAGAHHSNAQPGDARFDVVPKVGVYITAEDIVRARELVKTKKWAKDEATRILGDASLWARMSDEWYQKLMPPKGSVFAYGQTGCPSDRTSFGANFGGNGVVDLTRPFTLRCSNGLTIKFNDPESPYYDPGPGIQIDGVKYYLRGIYNAYITNLLAGWGNDAGVVHNLAYAYALTGDEQYAHKAMVILDALATLSPTTKGPRDFERNATSVEGRLHWLTSIVFRSRMHLINVYDLIYRYKGMDTSSPTNPGLSIKENIEKGLFLDYVFDEYDMRNGQLSSLHNHEADSVRGMLGVGLLLGIPDYITWGINGISRFLDNTIDRDGLYYETSLGYSNFSQGVFLDMAELAYNYSPDHYSQSGFPARSTFPYSANFYNHPKLQKFLVGFRDRVDAAGFLPTVGDGTPNWSQTFYSVRPLQTFDRLVLEQFAIRTTSESDRDRFASMLLNDAGGNLDSRRSGRWALFHATDLKIAGPATSKVTTTPTSEFMGHTGLGILRTGEGSSMRAAVMRAGVTLPHGHDDVLGLDLFGKGYDLNTEIGYGISGSPMHLGWGTRGIAHNLVVVNKGRARNSNYFEIGPGSDTIAFIKGANLAGMEMDAKAMFEPVDEVTQYQRGVWQVDVSANDYYWIDVFRVSGGKTHDYSFHARGANVMLDGIDAKAIPNVWTLHGLDDPNASFDAPGRSWGERVVAGEGIRDMGVASEGVKTRYWTPAPGNGYGFIYDLKGGQPQGSWSATWNLMDYGMNKLRLTMVGSTQAQAVYTGVAPDLAGSRKYPYLVARRTADKALQSRFAAVIQIYGGDKPVIDNVVELPLSAGHSQSVALKLQLGKGMSNSYDYVLSNPQKGITLATTDGATSIQTDALFALIRVRDGQVAGIQMVGGTKLQFGNIEVNADRADYNGNLELVDYNGRRLITRSPLPLGQSLAGRTVTLSNPGYAKNTAYTITGVSKTADGLYAIELGDSALELARNTVDRMAFANRVLTQKAPLPTAYEYEKPTRVMDGKLLVSENTGASAIIKRVAALKSVELVAGTQQIKPGDPIVIYDVQAGDSFSILSQLIVEREGDSWRQSGTVQGSVVLKQ